MRLVGKVYPVSGHAEIPVLILFTDGVIGVFDTDGANRWPQFKTGLLLPFLGVGSDDPASLTPVDENGNPTTGARHVKAWVWARDKLAAQSVTVFLIRPRLTLDTSFDWAALRRLERDLRQILLPDPESPDFATEDSRGLLAVDLKTLFGVVREAGLSAGLPARVVLGPEFAD